MRIEVHLVRGDAVTGFEFPEPGLLKVRIQMGRAEEEVRNHCSKVIEPSILDRVIKLWSDENHPKLMIESGRDLIIRESA
ncbi:MAG: hypothetical protein RIQ88_721 [Actinomycetota bacterium]|jgi:hypothetical protein